MNELEVYKLAYGRVAGQVAKMTADLELAYAQIDMLNEQIKVLKNPEPEQSQQHKNNDKEKDSK